MLQSKPRYLQWSFAYGKNLKAWDTLWITLTLAQPEVMVRVCTRFDAIKLHQGALGKVQLHLAGPPEDKSLNLSWWALLIYDSSISCILKKIIIIKKINKRSKKRAIRGFWGFSSLSSGHGKHVGSQTQRSPCSKGQPNSRSLVGSERVSFSLQRHRWNLRARTSKKLNKMANPSSSKLLLVVQQGAHTHWPFLLGLRSYSQWSIRFYAILLLFTTTLSENLYNNKKNSLQLLQRQGQSLALNPQEIQSVSRHIIVLLWSLSGFCEFCPWKAQPPLSKQLEEGGI